MSAPVFLISTIFELYLMVVLLRLWLQLVKADFYNPFSQFVVKATHPIIGPMRRVVPSIGNFDTSTLLLAFIVSLAKFATLNLLFAGGLPSISSLAVVASLDLLKQAFSLVFWVLLLRAILSWVSQGRNPIEYVMAQLTEPFLAPIRRIIPPLGGLDLSILVAIIGLQFVQLLLSDMLRMY